MTALVSLLWPRDLATRAALVAWFAACVAFGFALVAWPVVTFALALGVALTTAPIWWPR